jgi:hypothetical protein
VYVIEENNAFTKKWTSLLAKKNGKKIPLYEEKSLVGLTPGSQMGKC